jgi:hypothetical protein
MRMRMPDGATPREIATTPRSAVRLALACFAVSLVTVGVGVGALAGGESLMGVIWLLIAPVVLWYAYQLAALGRTARLAHMVVGRPDSGVALAAGRAGSRPWNRGLCIVATPIAVVGIECRLLAPLRVHTSLRYDEIVEVRSEEYQLEIAASDELLRLEYAPPSQLDAVYRAIQSRRA